MKQRLYKKFTTLPVTYTQYTLTFLLLVATTATTGSLYFSLGLGLTPCTLCWYQRILMYPLVPITLYALYKDELFTPLIIFMSGLGLTIAAYHSYIQYMALNTVCTSATPCHTILYTVHGLSIPNLSTIAFTLILGGSLISYYKLPLAHN